MMNPMVKARVKLLREVIHTVTDEERLEILEEVFQGYCLECGKYKGDRPCHCNNDE